jgi:hypothetical protein
LFKIPYLDRKRGAYRAFARSLGRGVNELTAVADRPARQAKTAGSEPVFTKLMTPEV